MIDISDIDVSAKEASAAAEVLRKLNARACVATDTAWRPSELENYSIGKARQVSRQLEANKPRVLQTFDHEFHMVCIRCKGAILDHDLYVVVHQYDEVDSDSELAVHARCLGLLS